MNPVVTDTRPRSSRLARGGELLVILAVSAAVIFALGRLGLGDTASYRRVTVENPTPYMINVDVTGAERDGWSSVGTVRRENRQTFEELPDRGDQWVFRFSYGGVDAGELIVSRDQLARDGWKISVPTEVTARLREAGLSESSR